MKDDPMKEVMQRVLANMQGMSPEEFQAALDKAKDSEVYKALKKIDDFSNYLFEQEEPEMQSWLTKEPSWIYWIKSPEGFWIRVNRDNMLEAQKSWDRYTKDGIPASTRPGFHQQP